MTNSPSTLSQTITRDEPHTEFNTGKRPWNYTVATEPVTSKNKSSPDVFDHSQVRDVVMTALLVIVATAFGITLLVLIHGEASVQMVNVILAGLLGFVAGLLYSRSRR